MEKLRSLVSIIIPCYNQARFLPEALESILQQTYPDWECIIVNDGSSDDTEQVAQEWVSKDARFRYVKKQNGGLSSARNAGLQVATGEYIQILDADDLLEADKLRSQMIYLRDGSDKVDILVSGYRYFKDVAEKRGLYIFGPANTLPEVALQSSDRNDLVKLFARTNPMVVSAPLYHRGVFEKVGRFDEDLSALEDWDFHFRCALSGALFQHIGYPPNSRALIRLHEHSMSADRGRMISSLRKFRQKHRSHTVFAAENDLIVGDFRKSIYPIVKMFIPPVFIWLAKRILKTA